MTKIGCVGLMITDMGIIALKCAKGRGIILPGGKPETGEGLQDACLREYKEETGIVVPKVGPLLLQAHCPDGFYVYTFLLSEPENALSYTGRDHGSGTVVIATWNVLQTSMYSDYYQLLEAAWKRK